MGSQLVNFPARTPAQLSTADDTILSKSGGQVSAIEVTVAAAIASQPHSLSPHANAGGNHGWAAQPREVAGRASGNWGLCSNTPVSRGLCFYHAKWGAKAHQCKSSCLWTPGN